MTYAAETLAGPLDGGLPFGRLRKRRRVAPQVVAGAIILCTSGLAAGLAGHWIPELLSGPEGSEAPAMSTGPAARPAPLATSLATPAPIAPPAGSTSSLPASSVPASFVPAPAASAPVPAGELFDPGFSFGPAPLAFGQSPPLDARFTPFPSALAAAEDGEPADLAPAPDQTLPRLALETPLPLPRPREFGVPERGPMPLAGRSTRRQSRMAAAAPPAAPEERGFFEKLFGLRQQPSSQQTPSQQTSRGPVLAYAAPQDETLSDARGPRLGLPSLSLPSPSTRPGPQTAIYDISARTVYMPNGEKLEAHSGLGQHMDDPRYVHVKMRGATPPAVYELTLREKLFHGVQALRMTPVDNNPIHGRNGILAHSYMLGPRGDSNGCVSFREYDKFLRAFMRGEIKRLVVVARMS